MQQQHAGAAVGLLNPWIIASWIPRIIDPWIIALIHGSTAVDPGSIGLILNPLIRGSTTYIPDLGQ